MSMEQIVVKTEMGTTDRELLVFYVDEDDNHQQGVLTAIQNIHEGNIQQLQQGNYIIEEVTETANVVEPVLTEAQSVMKERWLDDEVTRLLTFYIDNKETFLSGATKKKHLWTVACKTMLTGKNSTSCEMKLRNLKRSYSLIRIDQVKGKNVLAWPYYDLCHQAFHDDSYVNMLINDALKQEELRNMPVQHANDNGVVVTKKVVSRSTPDEKVEQMLKLYLKHKNSNNENLQKHLWEAIAIELGEDGDYWHKRFLNFKQHYVRMLDKCKESGPESINWPYMNIFNQIYENDADFQRKFGNPPEKQSVKIISNIFIPPVQEIDWDDTEKTVLVKYCFDCFDDFQDPAIPKQFLWNEIGKLLDKPADICTKKYEELKNVHLDQYISGGYNIRDRIPISILFDNIISKETEIELSKGKKNFNQADKWETEEIDELVQFAYQNLEMFKDSICHFVCWAAVAKKLNRSIQNCKYRWQDLTTLYKSILDDKKEDPEMEIDWRYIELFDRIFDYGMDTKLLDDYEKPIEVKQNSESGKLAVKKLNIKLEEEFTDNEEVEEYDERGFVKRSRGTGDSKQFKILEFYQKHKDKLNTTQVKKLSVWKGLAKEIGLSPEQCAHRFRNLKQVYTAYVQREVIKPEMPILWPYYALCKKVFGYRLLKNKLKNAKNDCGDGEEWTPKEIKHVIRYFSNNFDAINANPYDKNIWVSLSREIEKSETSCRAKFLELRKSYRKVKTVMTNNPESKVNWKYFKLFEEIYSGSKVEDMDVDGDSSDEKLYLPADSPVTVKNEVQEDEDYQCIIVMPEGEEMTQIIINNSNTTQENAEIEIKPEKKRSKWPGKDKKLLLKKYLNYIKSHKGKIINTQDMWVEISKSFPEKWPEACKKMYGMLKASYKQKMNDEQYQKTFHYKMFKSILAVKPKFFRPPFTVEDVNLDDDRTFKDIPLPVWKIEMGLKYYLEHLEEFVSPKYEHRYVWKELASQLDSVISKIFTKIQFLRQSYHRQLKFQKTEATGETAQFGELLKEILMKEAMIKATSALEPKPSIDEETDSTTWTDEETEQLLNWYLENLKKFKNPKYVKSYLWMEASNVLQKSPRACSNEMSKIRTQYRSMVKETPDALADWKFHELCLKIYGTGKKTPQ